MRQVTAACVVAMALFGCMEKQPVSGTPKSGGTEAARPADAKSIAWIHDLSSGLDAAKSSGKPVMVDFYADWCGWCRRLDETTYRDPELVALLSDFVCVKVNTDRDRTSPARYGVQGLPTIVFLDKSGGLKETVVGYRDAAFFKKLINEKLRTTL